MRWILFLAVCLAGAGCLKLSAQEPSPPESSLVPKRSPGQLFLPPMETKADTQDSFKVPLPAHAAKSPIESGSPGFRVTSSRQPQPAPAEEADPPATYRLPDRDEKPPITPEDSNLNLPSDLEITTTDTGEKILLPAGTYRQILQLPIDSPLMQSTEQTRRDQAPPVELKKPKSRYAAPERKPVWVRYESLEKIKIGEAERRGGIDVPSHGPKGLGPRVWYAKSETADLASSVFYFVFGGLGYSTANLLGWSAGNTREISGDFEYRLIRR